MPSKLDRHLNLLEILIRHPLGLHQIAYRANMGHQELRHHLGFLILNGVIEKRRLSNKKIVYAITERGLAVFKTLRALIYFEKLRDSLPIVEEAREITSTLSKHSRYWKGD